MPLNRPTQIELLEAVESYLREPIADVKADGFYRRVASNTLAIVQREIRHSAEFTATENALLAELLQHQGDNLNRILNEKIQTDNITFDSKLTAALLKIAEQKLEIDNPRYRLPDNH